MIRQVGRKAPAVQTSFLAAVQPSRGFSSVIDPNDVNRNIVLPKNAGRAGVSGIVATVFGASGFLGRYVVNRLGRIGSQCIIPYRGDGMNVRHLKLMGDLGQIVPLPMDLTNLETVSRSVDRSNVVVNLLGQQFSSRNYNFHDANVKCAYRIAKTAKEAGVERFIHVSALGADLDSESDYLKSKAEGELVVKMFYPDATIIRPAPMFGDEDQYVNRLANLAHFGPFVPLIDGGQQKVQSVYVVDVAAAIMNAVGDTRSLGKTYELGGSEIHTQEEVVEMIFKGIYRTPMHFSVPGPVANIYGMIAEKLPSRFRLLSQDMVTQMQYDMVIKNKIGVLKIQDLGVTPVGLSERMARILIRHGGQRAPARFTAYQ